MADLAARVCAILAALALSGCGLFGKDEEILPGERIPVRPAEDVAVLSDRPPLALPPAVAVSDWTHRNANPQHLAPHARLGASLSRLWVVDIGQGNSDRALMTAGPVASAGRVFVMDAAARVTALGSGGTVIWSTYVGREGEDGRDGFGGGLAIAGDRVFAATGFGEVLALSAATGEILWRAGVEAPVRAAPVVAQDRVIVVTREDRAFALRADTGAELWRIQGTVGTTGHLGGASPAADDVVAVLPFSSGEVTAVVAFSGRRIWSHALSGGRRGLARAAISDITGDPVIDGETIYVANQSGRLVSIDRRSGRRNWTVNDGSLNPVLPAGGSVFLVSDRAELIRLDAGSGARIWSVQLPEFEDPDDRATAIGYGGPILAGGRLIVTSTEGVVLSFDPETGRETGRVALPGPSYLPPAVAEGRLFVLTTEGQLVAFQ
ncbi:MAG: pyrrolo-quinoline quinone [Paracoccaceae bacterium]|nr:MAG: pyrrolo-quinoline quinone [Paracoccaceae bacterium]